MSSNIIRRFIRHALRGLIALGATVGPVEAMNIAGA